MTLDQQLLVICLIAVPMLPLIGVLIYTWLEQLSWLNDDDAS